MAKQLCSGGCGAEARRRCGDGAAAMGTGGSVVARKKKRNGRRGAEMEKC